MKFGIDRGKIVEALMRFPVIGGKVHDLHNRWLNRRFQWDRRYFKNPASRRRLNAHRPALSKVQQRVVDELLERGVATVRFEELLPNARWKELDEYVRRFSNSAAVRDGIQRYRDELAKLAGGEYEAGQLSPGQAKILEKYWISLYSDDETPTIPLTDPLLRAGMDAACLDIVNAYLGLWSKLIYFDLWHTIPIERSPVRFGAQRWHRDLEDFQKIRSFLYFSDVPAEAGPLQFVPGSHMIGHRKNLWPFEKPSPFGKSRIVQDELERLVPASEWVTCVGEPGTFVFFDGIGIHRGGASLGPTRVAASWAYVTPASLHRQRFRMGPESPLGNLPAATRFALS